MIQPFSGFLVSYAIDQEHPKNPARPAFIVCQKCGTQGIREAGYMQKTCTEITCKKCGHKASRKPNDSRSKEESK